MNTDANWQSLADELGEGPAEAIRRALKAEAKRVEFSTSMNAGLKWLGVSIVIAAVVVFFTFKNLAPDKPAAPVAAAPTPPASTRPVEPELAPGLMLEPIMQPAPDGSGTYIASSDGVWFLRKGEAVLVKPVKAFSTGNVAGPPIPALIQPPQPRQKIVVENHVDQSPPIPTDGYDR